MTTDQTPDLSHPMAKRYTLYLTRKRTQIHEMVGSGTYDECLGLLNAVRDEISELLCSTYEAAKDRPDSDYIKEQS